MRYAPERPVFAREHFRGRSRCASCAVALRWFELVPLFSFAIQRGRCRSCGARLSLQYPVVELLTGLLFFFVPRALPAMSGWWQYALIALFLAATAVLVLIALIDFRWSVIPDVLNIALVILGIGITAFLDAGRVFDFLGGSFTGHYALLFGWRGSVWINRLFAALAGGLFLTLIVLVTRGRGMGMGDIKFAAALGMVLGWPDAFFALVLSFVIGSMAALPGLLRRTLHLKSAIPFGPYMVAGVFVTLLFGYDILRGYFGLFPVA